MTRPTVASEPTVARTTAWPDYGLVDSGGGRKLERYGRFSVVRPEPQCLWAPSLPAGAWASADAIFDPSGEANLAFFPEQAANWAWLDARQRGAGRPLKILNLFGYTGVASLVCAAAGAEVTHVDASKKALAWARENAALSGLEDRPVRWIVEDARKYVAREVKRGNRYDGIILDPPKYGRGPTGEVWRLYEDLPELIGLCAELLSDEASFLLLNAYAERISGVAMASLLADALDGRAGLVDWGELALMEEGGERGVGLSFFARWTS